MRTFLISILSLFAVLPVNAELMILAPDQICSLLNDAGLATRGWKNHYGDKYGCSSPYKELGSGSPLANNLAFYAKGTTNKARQVKLVININNRGSASSAHKELVKTATAMSVKITGDKLPQLILDAIKKGRNASQQVGTAMVEVVREDWPTGKGYEVKVIIK